MNDIILQEAINISSPELESINYSKDRDTYISKLKNNFFLQSQPMLNQHENIHKINFPEKIIFVIDTVFEYNATQFKYSTGRKYGTLYMIKRVIEIFLHNKSMINHKHEFALITLDSQNVHWLCNFTGNLKTLLNILELVKDNIINNQYKYYNLQQIFKLIYQHVTYETSLLKNNIIRIILFYCRSNMFPIFDTEDVTVQELFKNSNLFVDVLYIHESLHLKTKYEEIYAELMKLNIKNVSYIIEVTRNAIKIHNYMAKLLTHPIQRFYQKDVRYFLYPSITESNQENKYTS